MKLIADYEINCSRNFMALQLLIVYQYTPPIASILRNKAQYGRTLQMIGVQGTSLSS